MIGMMIGLPGLPELLIIGLMLLVPVAIVIAVPFAVSVSRRSQPPVNPNLRPCPDCGRLVSLRAVSCPHCGRPLDPLQ